MPAMGGKAGNLTNSPSQDLGATFSPDGSYIAFMSDRGGGWGIWIMEADGANPRQLVNVPQGFGVDWSEERLSWGP
jgi:Tol biopolymer transport system component